MDLQIKHIDLFPTRIWQSDFASLSPQFDAWVEWILQARKGDVAPWGSNRGGWNSRKTLLQEPVFEPLAEAIDPVLRGISKEMGLDLPDAPLRTESWANVLDPGGFNFPHVHQNTILSACFYLRVPPSSGAIVFRDPRAGSLFSALRTKGVNSYGECSVQPGVGHLLAFPNWLEHRVDINGAQEPRISIALNLLGVSRDARSTEQ